MNFAFVDPHRPTFECSEATPIVFIVDGDGAMRESVASLVRAAGWHAASAASAEEFLAGPRPIAACCLVVEQHLPGFSGFDLQDRLVHRTEMPIIFMTGRGDVLGTVRAMKAGAFEVLAKPVHDDVLLSAIEGALDRSRATLHRLVQMFELRERYESLSRRQQEIMSAVVSGRLNKQIGGDLGISEITVKAHRGNVMRKMQARSLAELVRMAAQIAGGMMAHSKDRSIHTESIGPGRALAHRSLAKEADGCHERHSDTACRVYLQRDER
jgi:FixJ family two-component response regulator